MDPFDIPTIIASCLITLLYVTVYLAAGNLHEKASPGLLFKNHAYQIVIVMIWFLIVSGLYHGYRAGISHIIDLNSSFLIFITGAAALFLGLFTLFFIRSLMNNELIGAAAFRAIKTICLNLPIILALVAIFSTVYYLMTVYVIYKFIPDSHLAENVHMILDLLVALPVMVTAVTLIESREKTVMR